MFFCISLSLSLIKAILGMCCMQSALQISYNRPYKKLQCQVSRGAKSQPEGKKGDKHSTYMGKYHQRALAGQPRVSGRGGDSIWLCSGCLFFSSVFF